MLLKEDEEEIGGVDENVLLGLFATSGLGGFDLVARLAKTCFFTYLICLKDFVLYLCKRNWVCVCLNYSIIFSSNLLPVLCFNCSKDFLPVLCQECAGSSTFSFFASSVF